jgi:acyl-CoA synthetase (AMP-forming)/AMP-acid ligase II
MLLASNPYDGERKPGTVGFNLPGVDLALRAIAQEEEDGTDAVQRLGHSPHHHDDRAGAGDLGEIVARGPSVFSGYFERPMETRAGFGPDGWFRTGDLGELDDSGYLRIVGRIKELIITGGENVSPVEVEDVLRRHEAVSDVGVAGVPSPEWGEQVVAFVVCDGDVSADELTAFAARSLPPYKRPKRVVFVPDLPRNAMGKVVRSRLREQFGPTSAS